jgi:hypothetical protein
MLKRSDAIEQARVTVVTGKIVEQKQTKGRVRTLTSVSIESTSYF